MSRSNGIAQKIHRAGEHITGLRLELDAHLRDNYRIEGRFDSEARRYLWTAFGEPIVPARFAVIAGEVVHQLRSSLDHVVTALQADGPGGGDPARLEFPVCSNEKSFRSDRTRRKIEGVSPVALAAIEECQPYKDRSGYTHSVLWNIHDLDITDKHRVILVVAAVTLMADTLRIKKASRNLKITHLSPPPDVGLRPSPDGTNIFSVDFDESDPELQMEGDFRFDVVFGHPGVLFNRPVLSVLTQMRDYVVATIKQQFFPDIAL